VRGESAADRTSETMNASGADPHPIRASTRIYTVLLSGYPRSFRQAYGGHMAQVFRDACLDTHLRSGLSGLSMLWMHTLFDWFKTVIEEQLNRGTEMTRAKFIRLSGWAMILGAITFWISLQTDETNIRERLYRIAGPPVTRAEFDRYVSISQSVSIVLVLLGILLLIAGVQGLRLGYGDRSTRLGRNSLALSIAGGIIAAGSFIGLPFSEALWRVFTLGMALQFGSLAMFGIAAMRGRIMTRWNALPLVGGLYFPLFLLASLVFGWLTGGSWLTLPAWLETGLVSLSLASLALLGFEVQRDQGLVETGEL